MVLDTCEVRIGDYTLFGPGVQILTPLHPFDTALRRKQECMSGPGPSSAPAAS
jgi:maltose O-acetyltransferase